MSDDYTLQWPTGRGSFVEDDADRSPTGDTEQFAPGRVVTTDDVDVRDHYVDRGWEEIPPEEADDVEEPEAAKLEWDDFANRGYEQRASLVEDGDADHFLQRVYDEDDSINVQDAVEARAADVGVELENQEDTSDDSGE